MDGLEGLRTTKYSQLAWLQAARKRALRGHDHHVPHRGGISIFRCPETFEPIHGTHGRPRTPQDNESRHSRPTPKHPHHRPLKPSPERTSGADFTSSKGLPSHLVGWRPHPTLQDTKKFSSRPTRRRSKPNSHSREISCRRTSTGGFNPISVKYRIFPGAARAPGSASLSASPWGDPTASRRC